MKLNKIAVATAVGATAVLVTAGMGIASASQKSSTLPTSPSTVVNSPAAPAAGTADTETADSATDTDTIQSGDQRTPDTGSTTETKDAIESTSETGASETGASETGASYGNDGGHQDPAFATWEGEGGANEK